MRRKSKGHQQGLRQPDVAAGTPRCAAVLDQPNCTSRDLADVLWLAMGDVVRKRLSVPEANTVRSNGMLLLRVKEVELRHGNAGSGARRKEGRTVALSVGG